MSLLNTFELNIPEKLKDREYRHEFFKGRAEEEIATAIQVMREKRGMKQEEAAAACGMHQSAFSRIEQAEYGKWSFATLWRLAEVFDARWKIDLEPMEDVIREYEIAYANEADEQTRTRTVTSSRRRRRRRIPPAGATAKHATALSTGESASSTLFYPTLTSLPKTPLVQVVEVTQGGD